MPSQLLPIKEPLVVDKNYLIFVTYVNLLLLKFLGFKTRSELLILVRYVKSATTLQRGPVVSVFAFYFDDASSSPVEIDNFR